MIVRLIRTGQRGRVHVAVPDQRGYWTACGKVLRTGQTIPLGKWHLDATRRCDGCSATVAKEGPRF